MGWTPSTSDTEILNINLSRSAASLLLLLLFLVVKLLSVHLHWDETELATKSTSLPACSRWKPGRSSRRLPPLPVCFWHWSPDA